MNENEILAEAIERLNERVQKLENENEILRNNIEWLRLKIKKEDDKENTKLYMVTIDVIGDDYGTNTQLVGIYDTLEQAQKAKEENVYRYLPFRCKDPREVMETEAVIQVVKLNKTYDICKDAYSAIDEGAILLGCYIE